MKLLLVFSAFAISLVAAAQEEKDKLQRFGNKWKFQRPLRIIEPKDSSSLNFPPYPKKQPGVYRLPQDGMPCIVPDTKDVASIPNVWKGTIRTPYKGRKPTIPNPSQPNVQPDTK